MKCDNFDIPSFCPTLEKLARLSIRWRQRRFSLMKTFTKIFQTLTLSLFLFGAAQSSADSSSTETRIIENRIQYARNIFPIDRGGFAYPMALIGGTVFHTGPAPVYVTLRIGGQTFTALTDTRGDYSFFAYTAGAGRFEVQAWVGSDSSEEGGSVTTQGQLTLQK